MTLKNEDLHTKLLEDKRRTFLFTSWEDCRVSLSSTDVFIIQEGKALSKALETKWTNLRSAISECGILCIPLPPPFWGQSQLALVQSPISPSL